MIDLGHFSVTEMPSSAVKSHSCSAADCKKHRWKSRWPNEVAGLSGQSLVQLDFYIEICDVKCEKTSKNWHIPHVFPCYGKRHPRNKKKGSVANVFWLFHKDGPEILHPKWTWLLCYNRFSTGGSTHTPQHLDPQNLSRPKFNMEPEKWWFPSSQSPFPQGAILRVKHVTSGVYS